MLNNKESQNLAQDIIIDVKYPEIELIHTLEDDWNDIIKYVASKFPITKAILKESTITLDGNSAEINLKSKSSEFLHAYSVDSVLEKLFMNVYGRKYRVTYNENITDEEINEQRHRLEELQENVCKNIVNNLNFIAEENKKAAQELKQEQKAEESAGNIEEEPEEETAGAVTWKKCKYQRTNCKNKRPNSRLRKSCFARKSNKNRFKRIKKR